MEKPLTFKYDEIGDILYIQSVPPYADQLSDELAYNVVVRRNPRTEVIECVEILFFTRWLLQECETEVKAEKEAQSLCELFGMKGKFGGE